MSASARRKIVEQYQTIEQLTARVAELEAENELLKGRKNVELAANTDNAKSKQQRELAGPMEMGQLLAGSTHKTSGDLEIERTKPVTWMHAGNGCITDSDGKFIGSFSGGFRYRDRIICAVNSETELRAKLAAAQEDIEQWKNGGYTNLWKQRTKDRDETIERQRLTLLELRDQLAKAEQRVSEACANYVNRFINGDGILNEVWISDIESALRNGEWRKFVKEE